MIVPSPHTVTEGDYSITTPYSDTAAVPSPALKQKLFMYWHADGSISMRWGDLGSEADESEIQTESQTPQAPAPLSIEHKESKDDKPKQSETIQALMSRFENVYIFQRSANNTANNSS